MPDNVVLDSSALIAFLQGGDGAMRVLDLLEKAARNEATYSRVLSVSRKSNTLPKLILARPPPNKPWWNGLAVTWIHSDDALCAAAADVKSAHKVSFADSFVVATALRVQAILIHKDPEITALPAPLKQEMLPPKRASATTS